MNFYMNKSNREDVIELLYSDSGACVIVSQSETLESGKASGRIIRKSKKELKKDYKKASPKYIKVNPVPEDMRDDIINIFIKDRTDILDNTEEYIQKKAYEQRQEYFASITEQEYLDSLEEFKDVYQEKELKKKSIKNAQRNKKIQREMEFE